MWGGLYRGELRGEIEVLNGWKVIAQGKSGARRLDDLKVPKIPDEPPKVKNGNLEAGVG